MTRVQVRFPEDRVELCRAGAEPSVDVWMAWHLEPAWDVGGVVGSEGILVVWFAVGADSSVFEF